MSPPSEGAVAEQFTSDLLEASSIELGQLFGDTDDSEPEAHAGNSNFSAALEWARKGYNVVPQKAVDMKHPGVRWKEHQGRRATQDELAQWKHLFKNGVGFITGAISGVVVIETDGLAGETVLGDFEYEHGPLPETLVIRSGSHRGFHRHFKHPGGKVKTVANDNIKVDIRGDGGFCVLPPSLHKSGGRYEIVRDFEPAPLPDGLLEFIEMKAVEADMASLGTRAGAGLVTTPSHANNDELGENTLPAGRTPPPETMRAVLHHLAERNYFANRGGVVRDADDRIVKVGWIETGMALKPAYGQEVGLDLWGVTHIDDQARADAPAQWASFASEVRPGDVTIGTIIKAAKDAGFTHVLSARPASASPSVTAAMGFTGTGVDVENGKLFARMFQNRLLYVHETGEWLSFSPKQGWVSAQPGEADRAAKDVLAMLRHVASERFKTAGSENPIVKRMMAHVRHTSKANNLRAMIEMAKSEPGMTVRLSEFDDDQMLLGVANGVLNLRTGSLTPMSPQVLVSKRCNVAYDPCAKCLRFMQFLEEVQPDKEVASFLLRLMGYCLTGDVSNQVFGFFYGHGANGKSVFIELMAWLLGDYARKIPTDMLMHHQRNPQGPSPDIVSLKGLRLAFANETEEGRRLAEARVKDLTGGDTLTGRMVYGKADITFRPTHKLFVVGNHKPEITDTSFGMWRRVALIPFDQTIPEAKRDPKLLETLKAEGPGILNILLLGLRDCLRSGLQIPEKIKAATAAYRDEQDILGDWIAENCDTGQSCSVQKKVLYADYRVWTDRNGHRPFSQSKLTRRLNDRGYELAPDKRTVTGLALTAQPRNV